LTAALAVGTVSRRFALIGDAVVVAVILVALATFFL